MTAPSCFLDVFHVKAKIYKFSGSICADACDQHREYARERDSCHHARGHVHVYHQCDNTFLFHLLQNFFSLFYQHIL
jgi:hypothetical protein